jgi:hypothetical protein
MPRREILDRIQKYVHPFRITKGKGFGLKDFDPADTCGLKLDKGEAAELLTRGTQWLAQEQDMLYAQECWSLLLAPDRAGPTTPRGLTKRYERLPNAGVVGCAFRDRRGLPDCFDRLVGKALVQPVRFGRYEVFQRRSYLPRG